MEENTFMDMIYLATGTGLVVCQKEKSVWKVANQFLKDQQIDSISAQEGIILAGTPSGIYRSDDNGQHWHAANAGLTTIRVRWLAIDPHNPDLAFAGTEPAGIFVSSDRGEHWAERPEVGALRDEYGWMLPYSPEAGCVRGFAFHGQRIYAAVEVGGVLRSDNAGASWSLVAGSDGNPDLSGPPEPFVYPDVHDIAVHPSNPDLVFVATGGGLYRSDDGGATWDLLYDCYCRSLWLHPDDPERVIFGPAKYVGAVARIEATYDGGQTWQVASGDLDVPWPHTLPERICQLGDELIIVLDDGRLLSARLATLDWKYILPNVNDVNALAASPRA
jgi:photosystem II stability/assembly factor-like uncharacterized protein